MHWAVMAPFNTVDEEEGWLTPYVPGRQHTFRLLKRPAGLRDHLGGSNLSASGWWEMLKYARAAAKHRPDGVVTVFPQLAVACGLRGRCWPVETPIVAWCFNMGRLYEGCKGRVARFALRRVRKFVVHSRAEITRYSQWLDLPRERFEFVHLQRGPRPVTCEENRRDPFILAMGSAKRDYATFLAAAARLKVPTVVVAAPYALAGLTIPSNVTVKCGLTYEQCHQLAQQARINVVPISNNQTACGQVTVIDAMSMRRAVVATDCIGTSDYIEPERTGLLVEPESVPKMAGAIERLWDDAALRERLGASAQSFALEHCSDQAAGRALKRVLDEVAGATSVETAHPFTHPIESMAA